MTAAPTAVRRILVALDGVSSTSAGLDLAVQIAGQLQAELEGVFVEDSDLLRVAALPFTRQINFATGDESPLETPELESDMTRRASVAERRLAAAATQRRVKWSFRRVRGRVTQEIETASAQTDLIVVEGEQQGGRLSNVRSTAIEMAVQRSSRTVMVTRPGALAAEVVAVIYDGSPGAAAALAFGLKILTRTGVLTVVLDTSAKNDATALEATCRAELGVAAPHVQFKELAEKDWPTLCQTVSRDRAGLFLIAHDSPLLAGDGMRRMLKGMKCPVCVVR